MKASPNFGSPGRRSPTMSASTSVSRSSPALPRTPLARPGEHRRIDVDAGDEMAGLGQRDGQPPGTDREFEDRPVDAVRQRQIQVEVARIVGEIEVVQAREGGRRRGVGSIERRPVDDQPSQRTRPPSRRLTASALMASSAARLAAAAVVSA